MAKKLLVCGFQGHDIINASLLYFAALSERIPVVLGSCRMISLDHICDYSPFGQYGAIIDHETIIEDEEDYEPRIAEFLEDSILLFSRQADESNLATTLTLAQSKFGFTHMIFVDGKGSSLIPYDRSYEQSTGEHIDLLAIISNLPNCFLAISSAAGIPEKVLQQKIETIKEWGGYLGRVNMMTREKRDYDLESVLKFEKDFIGNYLDLGNRFIAIREKHAEKYGRLVTQTAKFTYRSLAGFDPRPERQWMYFFDPSIVEVARRE